MTRAVGQDAGGPDWPWLPSWNAAPRRRRRNVLLNRRNATAAARRVASDRRRPPPLLATGAAGPRASGRASLEISRRPPAPAQATRAILAFRSGQIWTLARSDQPCGLRCLGRLLSGSFLRSLGSWSGAPGRGGQTHMAVCDWLATLWRSVSTRLCCEQRIILRSTILADETIF